MRKTRRRVARLQYMEHKGLWRRKDHCDAQQQEYRSTSRDHFKHDDSALHLLNMVAEVDGQEDPRDATRGRQS
ncbi:MAG: hypothetical protein E6J90_40690 [Deltaproteobacteria bacterium]|nr:MAG: hypothetical protein E6J90_40690 [Deltaproteobacteria bacterium]